MRIRVGVFFLSLALLAIARGGAGDSDHTNLGSVRVTITRVPERRLDFEVVVPAGRAEVWKAFTTSEGLASWIAPVAKVELKVGGPWEVGFAGAAPGGGTITSFVPMEMLSIRAMAPENFPTVRRERTLAVFRFEEIDPQRTHVTLAQTGWQSGEEWDRAFEYLSKGNAQLLDMLYRRFQEGPIRWDLPRGK